VLRYDTAGNFSSASSWSAFDAGAHGVGVEPAGYTGAAFDGQYVYFAPYHNSRGYHGEVLRYNTAGSFADVSSWSTFNPGGHGVGRHAAGFAGVIAVGQFVYFVPYYDGSTHSGEVLRYDITGSFSQSSSWTAFDAESQGLGTSPAGYNGAVSDGRYIYFAPASNNSGNYHGEVLRYDTMGSFSDLSSWSACDPGVNGVGNDPDGYAGAVFDGHYVYFVPYATDNGPSGYHGEVLRYDTTGGD
jgi:hypothetical protein